MNFRLKAMPFPASKIVVALTALATIAAVLFGVVSLGGASVGAASPLPSVSPSPVPVAEGQQKNVVLILADDLDWALFNQIPRLAALKREALTFTSFVVTDSLCCPSRTSLMRSQYVHNHHVVSNVFETGGGFPTFVAKGLERDCLPTWLSDADVSTAMFGKYLNEYPDTRPRNYVPPGWGQWASPITHGGGYRGFDYKLNVNGRIEYHGKKPKDFMGTVITRMGVDFIRSSSAPFFLMLTPFAPHLPSATTKRHADQHQFEVVPRTESFANKGSDPPSWLVDTPGISTRRMHAFDVQWADRARSAETVADMVDSVRAELVVSGHDDDTLIIVASDNGYHAGAHGMSPGKRSPYAEDAVVPFLVLGPGVPKGRVVSDPVSMVDVGPTVADLLGADTPDWVDGRSFALTLRSGVLPPDWKGVALTESLRVSTPGDPDYEKFAPPRFSAIRTGKYLYVEYATGEVQLHDEVADPAEIRNIAGTADPALLKVLSAQLAQMRSCAGRTCNFH